MVLVGVVLASLFLLVVMRWWAEGILEASDALLLTVAFGGLIFGLFASRELWQIMLAFVPLAAGAAYLIYNYTAIGTRSFLKQRCQEYMQAIQFDPRNLGAREYLAETLYNLGELDRAIDEMQVAVNMGAGLECRYRLDKWIKERHLRDTLNPVCKWCFTENAPGARKCSRCGSELPYDNVISRWLTGGKTKSARYYLILTIGAALIAVSLVFLPLKYAFIPVVACVLTVAGWWLIISARG